MSRRDLTPWFPKIARPAHAGDYQVLSDSGTVVMMNWNGARWIWPATKQASPYANMNGVEWRGLLSPIGDEVWTQRNGVGIRVCDMTEDHVRSALRMVLRRVRQRDARSLAAFPAGQ